MLYSLKKSLKKNISLLPWSEWTISSRPACLSQSASATSKQQHFYYIEEHKKVIIQLLALNCYTIIYNDFAQSLPTRE